MKEIMNKKFENGDKRIEKLRIKMDKRINRI